MSTSRLFLILLIGCQVPTQVDPESEDASELAADPSDCSFAITVPGPRWVPTSVLRIPVVFQIIA
jgi:hypothetical protein